MTVSLSYQKLGLAEMLKAFAELSLLFDEVDVWSAEEIKAVINGQQSLWVGKLKITLCLFVLF